MQQRQLPLLVIIVAVLLGLRVPFSTKKAEPAAPTENAASETTPSPGVPIRAVSTQPSPAKLAELGKSLCNLSPRKIFGRALPSFGNAPKSLKKNFPDCLEPGIKITPVIASVPDPIHTHLGLVFDRTLDAIQSAAASHGYLLFLLVRPRTALPADSQPHAALQEGTGILSPGMLVFRNAGTTTATDYLVVFLVPESPTAGINWSVFKQAEDLVIAIQTRTKSSKSAAINFAGPLYSGSVGGLLEVNQKRCAQQCIHAISGTVTNPAANKKDAPPNSHGSCDPQFLQTADVDAILALATEVGYKDGEVAVLSEEGTEYGQLEERLKDKLPQILSLHFPREISRLRNAYGTDTSQTGVSSGRLPMN